MARYFRIWDAALELARMECPDRAGQRIAAERITRKFASEIEAGRRRAFFPYDEPVGPENAIVAALLDWAHGRAKPPAVQKELVRTGETTLFAGMAVPVGFERETPVPRAAPLWTHLRIDVDQWVPGEPALPLPGVKRPPEGTRQKQFRMIREKAAELGIDLERPRTGEVAKLRDALRAADPPSFSNWPDIWKDAKAAGIARPVRTK